MEISTESKIFKRVQKQKKGKTVNILLEVKFKNEELEIKKLKKQKVAYFERVNTDQKTKTIFNKTSGENYVQKTVTL